MRGLIFRTSGQHAFLQESVLCPACEPDVEAVAGWLPLRSQDSFMNVCVCVHAHTYGGQNTGCILRQGFSLNTELRLVASKSDNPVSAPPSVLVLWGCVWSHLAFYVGAGGLTWFLTLV